MTHNNVCFYNQNMAFKALLAKSPNISQFKNELKKDIKKAGDAPKKDFERTTSTWQHKPNFEIKVTETKNKIELFVGVESNYSKGKKATSNDIYRFVTRGTAKRRALMSADFVPKTKKGVIGSGAGRGGVIRISKNLELPGIESRDFEPVITRKNKSGIEKQMAKSFGLAAIKINWKL